MMGNVEFKVFIFFCNSLKLGTKSQDVSASAAQILVHQSVPHKLPIFTEVQYKITPFKI